MVHAALGAGLRRAARPGPTSWSSPSRRRSSWSARVGVVVARNPVHAALSLVMTLFGVAVLFIEQEADFLAAVQIIVYAGAIVVLFLFVIMFLGVDRAEDINVEPLGGPAAPGLRASSSPWAASWPCAATAHWVTGARQVVGPHPRARRRRRPGGGTSAQLGKQLFTTYLFAFEATAALLVIAVVGAVVLARRPPAHLGADEADADPADGTERRPPRDAGHPAADAEPVPTRRRSTAAAGRGGGA